MCIHVLSGSVRSPLRMRISFCVLYISGCMYTRISCCHDNSQVRDGCVTKQYMVAAGGLEKEPTHDH